MPLQYATWVDEARESRRSTYDPSPSATRTLEAYITGPACCIEQGPRTRTPDSSFLGR